MKIALENLDRFEPMGSAELLPRLVKEAQSPAVGFCLDSGHAHCCGHTSDHPVDRYYARQTVYHTFS
ncbi:MAG: hypothetical protein ACLR23_12090 [Clostridia bacterium]